MTFWCEINNIYLNGFIVNNKILFSILFIGGKRVNFFCGLQLCAVWQRKREQEQNRSKKKRRNEKKCQENIHMNSEKKK